MHWLYHRHKAEHFLHEIIIMKDIFRQVITN